MASCEKCGKRKLSRQKSTGLRACPRCGPKHKPKVLACLDTNQRGWFGAAGSLMPAQTVNED